jgi:sugar lactone lactonase YvrE
VGFTIPESDFIAEGVAYDPVEKAFYSGSILKKKIVKIDQNGKTSDFSSAADGLLSVLGMSVDSKHRTLWASAASFPELGDSKKYQTAIFKYDLVQHKLLKRYPVNTNPEGNQLGDVIVSSAGDAYTTDSFFPAVYWIPHDKDTLELLIGGDVFRSPQGLCLSSDERILYVADYVRGIFAIDLKTGSHQKLSSPQNATIAGIDGLYCYKDRLIATQNGVKPNRVLQLLLNQDRTAIKEVRVLESNHHLFTEITLGTVAENALYYVANSQFGEYVEDRKIKIDSPLILKLTLAP